MNAVVHIKGFISGPVSRVEDEPGQSSVSTSTFPLRHRRPMSSESSLASEEA